VVVTAVLFLTGYADVTKRGGRAVNWRGALLLTAILVGLLLGIGKGSANPWLLATAGLLAVPFFWLERRSGRPILPPDLFLNPAFRICALTLFLLQVSYIAFLPLYLQGAIGLSPTAAGYLQSIPLTITLTASTFVVGKFITRHGYRRAVRLGALCAPLLAIASTLAASLYNPDVSSLVPAALVVAQQALMGLFMGLAMTSAVICVQNQVVQARRGTATASIHLMRNIGSALAPALLGYLLATGMRGQHLAITPDKFLDQKGLPQLLGHDATALAAARAGLGSAMSSLFPVLIGLGVLAFVVSLFFPKAVVDIESKSA
jgi:hypothetical protein